MQKIIDMPVSTQALVLNISAQFMASMLSQTDNTDREDLADIAINHAYRLVVSFDQRAAAMASH